MLYGNLILIGVLGLLAGLVLTSTLIPIIKNKQAGQNIRAEGPKSHLSKSGTPSMGGIAIVIATVIAAGIGGFVSMDTVVLAIGFLGFALIGFLDDYLKVIKKVNLGLRAYQKFGLQTIVSAVIAVYIGYFSGIGTETFIPFAKIYVDLGILYVPFIMFTILAIVNAVNLTDGLDGLASGVTIMVSLFIAIAAMVYNSDSASVASIAMTGALLGFLAFNKNPAKIFMGDTGSLAIGGMIVTAAVVMKMPLILPIIGIVYLMEALSVVLQVGYFKISGGKRIFKMSPLHHHFELCGMKEKKVVLMFWAITALACGIGIFGVF